MLPGIGAVTETLPAAAGFAAGLGAALGAGAAATGGQLSITKAYTKAPAKEISVFDYSQIVFAAFLGFLFLHEIPDCYSTIGYVIIIGIAVFKWWYNCHYEK